MMTTIYKLCLAMGLLATGGEVATRGNEHAAKLKKLASPFLADERPNKSVETIPLSEFSHLPFGVKRIEE